jgi:hypothetical protein
VLVPTIGVRDTGFRSRTIQGRDPRVPRIGTSGCGGDPHRHVSCVGRHHEEDDA